MLKVARQEVSEIEACPDCFAHGRNLPRPLPSWFIEPCRRPHPIVWAKLKGFPFWPAKAMPRLNTQGLVDVRFFGEHDRAWVSPKDIYLYSQEPPAVLPRKKKLEMEQCVKEVEDHSKKLEEVFGEFRYDILLYYCTTISFRDFTLSRSSLSILISRLAITIGNNRPRQ
jgi:hypothetical protein